MITSLTNPKVKQLIQLRNRSRARREADVFVVEGIRMFQEIPVEKVKEVYVTESFLKKYKQEEKLKQLRYEVVSEEVFAKMSDTMTPQGVFCVVSCFHYTLREVLGGENPLVLALEDIQDPGNLGTMLRTAEGAGVTGIVMSKGCVDIYNPKVIRSTMGSVYRMPFYVAEDLGDTLEDMKKQGFSVYGAALGDNTEYTEVSYAGKSAILIGNEGNGLKDETLTKVTKTVLIPMAGQVESLNASVSAAVLMYEASRQRRDKQSGK